MLYWPLIISAVLIITYTFIASKKFKNEIHNWFGSIIGTLSSVLIGISIAIYLFNYQNQLLDISNKEKHLKLLSLEITELNARLTDKARATITTHNNISHKPFIVGLDNSVLRQAGLSGLFDEDSTFIMLDLSSSIDFWNTKTNSLIQAINASPIEPGYNERLSWYITDLDKSAQGILKGLSILCERLKIQLRPTSTY